MSELQLLYVVLVVIYGWECACWIRRGAVVFRTWLGRKWRPAHPGTLLANQHGGLVFAPPLPPLGTVLTGNQLPVSLSPDGVLAFVASAANPGGRPPQTGGFVRFAEVQKVEAKGKNIRVNGQRLLKATSATYAADLATQIQQFAKLPRERRQRAIEAAVDDALDCESIEQRWQEFQAQTSLLRWMTNALFGYLFVLVPLVAWRSELARIWAPLLVGLLASSFTIAVLFRRAHLRFYPRAEDDRFNHFLVVMLSPLSAIRALDLLSRPLFETFHPLALASVFCSPADFSALAEAVLRELRHPAMPTCPRADTGAEATELEARKLWLRKVEQFIKQSGLNGATLLQPPSRTDPACLTYCPRCLAQFTTAEGTCADCGGLPLVPFSAPTPVSHE